MRIAIASVVAVLVLAGPALADWKGELTGQMLSEYNCKVGFISHIIERRVGDKHIISAKVHCRDQRAFDVTRERPMARFKVRRCKVQKSC